MKVVDLLRQRRQQWQELDQLCSQLETGSARRLDPTRISRFAALYRAACADLALADAYQLPHGTTQYLHRLVGRAHNQLYRSRKFDFQAWGRTFLVEVPRRIFDDGCVQIAFCLFWGVFLLAALLAASPDWAPGFAERMVGDEALEQYEQVFSDPLGGRNSAMNPVMASFYIYNNTGIGLRCFAAGLLVIPGLLTTIFNAAYLGSVFGYMARADVSAGYNFYNFVTAHGPFELTAIVLSAGAGLRLGMSWLSTHGLTRAQSLRRTARHAMPIMGAAMVLFFLAALIEAFLSPTGVPYPAKATVAVLSSGLLMFYFIVLGFPRSDSRAFGSDTDRHP
jgi:uncharacterized membrane protein SpoIIM required for sporulation